MKMKNIGSDLWVSSGTPSGYCRKALQLVNQFHYGSRNYIRLADRGCGYIKINIGPFWRLLSRNGGKTWLLLNHERYNSVIRK